MTTDSLSAIYICNILNKKRINARLVAPSTFRSTFLTLLPGFIALEQAVARLPTRSLTMDNKPTSLKSLLKKHKLSLDAATCYSALVKKGILRDVTYESTTGSGALKTYREIQPEYEDYGVNKKTMHEFKTEPKFFPSKFPALVRIVADQIAEETKTLESLGP